MFVWIKNEYERGESLTLNGTTIAKIAPLGFTVTDADGRYMSYYPNIEKAKAAIEKKYNGYKQNDFDEDDGYNRKC